MGFIVFSISEILNVYPMISKVSLSLFVSGFCSICLIQRTRLITKKINQVFWRIPFVIGLSLNLIKDEQLFIQVCYIILALSVLQLLIKPKNISHYVIRHAFKLLGIICITYLLYIFKLESLYIGFALIYLFSLQIINALKLKVVFNEA
ncbi:MAG: hypothetical protein N4A33_13340 [Bacteriovoracaceae bacterium]|jgi:hypothetical protein|nr:hypothetical protein [Bacteriovoracaceae bacterium]